MTSTEILINALSDDLVPVRRRSVWREVASLAALGTAEVAAIVMLGATRPDMAQVIATPFMTWKIGSLALIVGVATTVALRSFAPPNATRKGLMLVLMLAGLAIVLGAMVMPPAFSGRSLIERLSVLRGLMCAGAIVVLSLPLMALLGAIMRRAAPVDPRRSAIAAGLCASTLGALVFTACCPMNDPLYVAVWYSAGVAAVTASARYLLSRRFRL
ncbi:MAG: DUF1109 domain-containing protein [Novosphingobium sp.]